jgi:hypothetical protein
MIWLQELMKKFQDVKIIGHHNWKLMQELKKKLEDKNKNKKLKD